MASFDVSPDFDRTTPAVATVDVVLSDTEDLPRIVKALWINSDGEVAGISPYDRDDEIRVYTVFAGTALPVAFRRITLGTTADFVAITM